MCFDATAAVPPAPRTGVVRAAERLRLTSADATVFAATLATTSAGDAPGVVILPDVRGLHGYYEELAEAFAGAGVHAIAIDFYARTAGADWRGDEFDHAAHRDGATDATITLDVTAAMQRLVEAGATRIFTLGFCKGGRAALLQATRGEIAGAIGFYPWPARSGDGGSPISLAEGGAIRAPVLALYGGEDLKIPAEDRNAFDGALEASRVPHESVVYPGAPHSFFDRKMDAHRDACVDAWTRVLAFIDG